MCRCNILAQIITAQPKLRQLNYVTNQQTNAKVVDVLRLKCNIAKMPFTVCPLIRQSKEKLFLWVSISTGKRVWSLQLPYVNYPKFRPPVV